ncbi:MAG: hypothetical protein ACTHM9_16900 [Gemmatimonadales bacterium]
MIARRDTLEQALAQIEARTLTGASTVVVSRAWWEQLSPGERDHYRKRAERAAIELRADHTMSSHFVEVRGGDEGPPLASESPM